MFTNQRRQIAELAAKKRLPAVYSLREHVEAGGFMVYGANPLDLERRAATFVDKILLSGRLTRINLDQPNRRIFQSPAPSTALAKSAGVSGGWWEAVGYSNT